jgi:hypothetical protein
MQGNASLPFTSRSCTKGHIPHTNHAPTDAPLLYLFPSAPLASTLRFLTAGLLEATKAMAPSDRYSLADVEAIMAHGRATVVDHVKLLRLVYTTKQAVSAVSGWVGE